MAEAGLAWREIALRPPPPRLYGASLVACARGLLLFGGSSPEGSFSSQLFLIDPAAGTCTDLRPAGTVPGERHFHAAAFHEGYLYVHGGKSNGYHHDLHRYSLDTNAWTTLVPPRPGPAPGAPLARFGHTAVVLDGALYVFGGYDQHGWLLADLFRFDLRTATWTRLPPPPSSPAALERMHHVAVAHGRTMLVQGGRGEGSAALADLVEYHVDAKSWARLVCSGVAPARSGHSAAFVAASEAGGVLAVFGGAEGPRHSAELHLLDLRTRHWRLADLPHAPAARYFAAATAAAQGVFIFGGKNAHNACFADLHLLAPAPAPAPTHTAAATAALPVAALPAPAPAPGALGSSGSELDEARGVLRLKCTLNNEIRVLSVPSRDLTYASLSALLASEYGVEAGSLRVQYTDPEGDRITVRSERDLAAALHYAKNSLLRLLLSPLSMPLPSSVELASPPASPAVHLSADAPGRHHTPTHSHASGPAHAVPHAPVAAAAGGVRRREVLWVKGPLLDQGAFGAVYLAMEAHTGAPFAVKTLALGQNTPPSAAAALQREIDLLATLSHPHIVRYLGSAVVDSALHIFMEFVPSGSLAALIRKFRRLPEAVVARYTAQVLSGLAYVHERGIVHRDVKGANVLVDAAGNLKLADFGAAKQLDQARVAAHSGSGGGGGANSEACQTVTGTPYYMAPEVIQGARHYGRKADVWSLGALVVEMSTGAPPYADLPPVAALFRIGSDTAPMPLPAHLSPPALAFLGLCFTRDPRARPTARKLQEHAFVAAVALPALAPQPPPEPLLFVLAPDARAAPPPGAPLAAGSGPGRPASLTDSGDSARDSDASDELDEQRILQFLQSSPSIVASRDFLAKKVAP